MCVCVCVGLVLSDCFATPWAWSLPGSSVEFSRQEHWSGLPFPTPGALPDPGIEPASLALVARFFTSSATWEILGLGIVSMTLLKYTHIKRMGKEG